MSKPGKTEHGLGSPRLESVHRRLALFLSCILVTGAILLVTAAAFLLFSQKQLSESAETTFNSAVNAILYHIRSQPVLDHAWLSQTETGGGLILHVELDGRPLLFPGAVDTSIRTPLVDEAKTAALTDQGLDLAAPPLSNIQTQEVRYVFTGADGDHYRAAAAVIPLRTGWAGVVVVRPMAPENAQMVRQLVFFGGLTLAALGLLALFAWHFTRRSLRPIEESQRRQAEFVAAASHELRSPLAVIHASLTALKTAPPEQASHFADLADGECMRMSRLVGDLLALAHADSGTWSVLCTEAELETLVLTVCEGFEARAAERGVHLDICLPEQPLPRCRCDRERVAQVLTILIDNGLSYTPSGGRVTVSAGKDPAGFRLAVSDTGPGIPDSEKARVFERFYRSDPSRTGREHYGLGLCVAKEIASLHGGSLTLTDTPGGGATFTLILP